MNNKRSLLKSNISKISFKHVLPFIVWPLLFCVAFFLMYSRFVTLYVETIEYKSENMSHEVADTFEIYLTQIDNTLKSSVAALEYMISDNESDQDMLEYISYQSEKLGIVSATGSRGIFGVFRGSFLHGLGWNPENYDPTERIWYQEAVKNNGQYVFVGPYFNKRTDEYVVTAVKLLEDGESVIAFAIDYETFKSMTTSIVRSDDKHMILAMNEKGVVLANSNNDEMGEDYSASEDPLKKGIYRAIFENHGKSTFQLRAGDGVTGNYVISRRHVLYDLYVVTVTDESEELKELRRSATVFGSILFLGMTIILILNVVSLHRSLKDRQRTENLNSITNIFMTMLRIDMVNGGFQMISCADYKAVKIIEDGDRTASDMLKELSSQMVDERSRDAMLIFADLSTLNERMTGRATITGEFLSYEHIWHRARFIVVDRAPNGSIKDVLFATEIIDDEKRALDRFQYLAETDQLTGINNRGSGETKIRDLLLKNVGGMFILFDVDKFKYVNDHFGHDVGDQVLMAVGEKMRHCFREKDIVLRLGGDEFAAYMPSIYTESGGNQVLERFIQSIHKMDIEALGDHQINVSIGAAFYYPTDTFKFEELYRRADACTYQSKKAEGSIITFYKRRDSEYIEGE